MQTAKCSGVSPGGRAILAASIGNAFEWFDLSVYGFFAITMAKAFFPADAGATGLSLTLASFGLTFVMRPVGAVIIGPLGDRYGRKVGLTIAMFLMTAATATMALAPTYAAAGPLAPVVVVAARMVQGLSAGGEFGNATVFLAEQSRQRRGFYASWQFASQALSAVLATGFGVVLNGVLDAAQLEAWGWRIPFLCGCVIGPIGIYLRRRVDETPEFRALEARVSRLPEALAAAGTRLLVAFGLVVLVTVSAYTILFMPTYAISQLGLPPSGAFLAGLATGLLQLVLIPAVGALSDRYGRLIIAGPSAAAIALASYPLFGWLAARPTLATMVVVEMILGALVAGYVGAIPALLSELFPTRIRATALSVSYSLSVAVFGGFAPSVSTWLIAVTGSKLAPSYYLVAAALGSLAAVAAARRIKVA